ncbi:MAG TPA: ABC transporter permease [Baekduia sp.]|uniref:ABC transporter permease n=1 Tax=Baekduia sp. TaxID=2600305 RepID=UPI002C43DA04|nr:ABC transporter permease [Baekduia sp.]HMJ35643.1 ABC transporter permease [Baekduia sp.]
MRFLLAKDLRILRRSPLLVALLVIYPIIIALLVGLALSKGPDKPRVAILNQLPPSTGGVSIGGTTVDPKDYADRLFESIEPVTVHSRAEAERKVRDGDVLAAIVVPPDLVTRLQRAITLSGGQKPTVEVLYNAEDPVKQQFVQSTIDSRVADLNRAVSTKLTQVAASYLDILLSGGRFSILGRDFDVLGLKRSKALVDSVLTRTPEASPDREALQRVSAFAQLAIDNLGLSDVVLGSLATPVKVDQTIVAGRRTPLDAFAVTVAVTMSLMLVCVLLAAGMLALEREEHAFARLVRGLVSRWALLTEKVVLAAGCAAAAALLMTAGVSVFVSLDWARFPLWVVALGAGGLAFGALGVAIGALAREVRAASLLAILLALPVAFLALVPSGAVAQGLYDAIRVISALFPFRPALDATDAALNDAGGLGAALAHLAALVVGWSVVARVALQRFA